MSAIIQYFDHNEIKIYEAKNDFWFTSRDIAKSLEIKRKSVWNIFDRHRDILLPHTCVLKLGTQDQIRKIRVFDRTGTIWIAIRSNSPKALPFQEFILQVIDDIIKKGYYIDKGREQSIIISFQEKLEQLLSKFEKLEQRIDLLKGTQLDTNPSFKFSHLDSLILKNLENHHILSIKELCKNLNTPRSTLHNHLLRLEEYELICYELFRDGNRGRPLKVYKKIKKN